MNALLTMFSSLPLASIWGKVKLAVLAGALAFMVWQGYQMMSLQQDVTKLETVQSSLQAQVQQMSVDYSVLRDNYKNSAKTSEQYIQSVQALSGKSTDLEKSFTALEVQAAQASQKADTALSLQRRTTPTVNHETSSKSADKGTDGDVGSGDDGTDADWRRLLDNTYCDTFPDDAKCSK